MYTATLSFPIAPLFSSARALQESRWGVARAAGIVQEGENLGVEVGVGVGHGSKLARRRGKSRRDGGGAARRERNYRCGHIESSSMSARRSIQLLHC